MNATDCGLCLVMGFDSCGVELLGSTNGEFIEIWCQDCVYVQNGQHLATVLRMSVVYIYICFQCAGVSLCCCKNHAKSVLAILVIEKCTLFAILTTS